MKLREVRNVVQRTVSRAPLLSHVSYFSFSRFRGWVVGVFLALIAVNIVVYAPVWHHNFINFDDPAYVSKNPNVTAGFTWRGLSWALAAHEANWHPLTWLSHSLDAQVYGLDAGGHHLTNVVLHIANTLLLFSLLYRMTGGLGRSAFVAGLFAVHPLHVESVAWIAERKDVLSTLFWMLTLGTYVEYVRQPRLRLYLAVCMFFAFGLMSKPMVVTLPFQLLLLDFWPLGRLTFGTGVPRRSGLTPGRKQFTVPQLVREKLPLLALAAASSVVTFVAQRQEGTVANLDVLSVSVRVGNALVSYVAYIGKMIWPTRLAVFYPYEKTPPLVSVRSNAVSDPRISPGYSRGSPTSLRFRGMVLVSRNTCTGHRGNSSRNPIDGGPLYLCPAHRVAPSCGMGNPRPPRPLAAPKHYAGGPGWFGDFNVHDCRAEPSSALGK